MPIATAGCFIFADPTIIIRSAYKQWQRICAWTALLSCGALLAVYDGLKFAVRVSGRFLRGAVFLCLA